MSKFKNIDRLDCLVSDLLSQPKAKDWSVEKKEKEICRVHPVYWLETYGWIKQATLGESGKVEIIPLKLNPVQLQIADQIALSFSSRPWKRVQTLVLKHRKAGISTLIAGFDYWLMRTVDNCGAFVIADLSSHTANIFAMVEIYHQRDRCPGKPRKVALPGGKKGLKLSNGALCEMDSGENANPGTSGTLQVCHMSENAKWRDPLSAETSLLNSVPRDGFVFVVKESTAYGMNKYASDCENAQKPGSAWDFIFIRWSDLPDCHRELKEGEIIEYEPEEQELVSLYGLKRGHIKFRREQIDLLGSVERFKQDFPLNPQEPFLVTGSFFFDTERVRNRIQEIKMFRTMKKHGIDQAKKEYPEVMHRLVCSKGGLGESMRKLESKNVIPETVSFSDTRGKVSWVKKPKGRAAEGCATMFRSPDKNHQYLVVIDSAEGIRTSEYVSDNAIVNVIDPYRWEQVLEWGGCFDEEITALYAVYIAKVYNNAMIVVEMSGRSGGVLKGELDRTGYKNYWYRQSVRSNQTVREFGWETTRGNKSEVCSQFRLDFKNGVCTIHSLEALEEMLWFNDINGKLGASPGHTDDRVMTLSIASWIIRTTPAYHVPPSRRSRIRQESDPQIWDGYKYPTRMPGMMAPKTALRR